MTGLETVMAAAAAEAITVKTVLSPAETMLMLPVTIRLHSVRMRLLLGKTQLQPAKAPAANAVVLGKDSVADRDNTISVGAEGRERAIANVAPGEKGTDAVNVNQLNQGLGDTLAKARQYTDEKFKEQRRESQAGSASAIAIAGLPQATAPGKSMVAVSSGLYRRESAI